jgi:hypothetical protein
MQAVATEYFFEIWRPVQTSESVMVGWRREWSIMEARSGREIRRVLGMDWDMVGGRLIVRYDWDYYLERVFR